MIEHTSRPLQLVFTLAMVSAFAASCSKSSDSPQPQKEPPATPNVAPAPSASVSAALVQQTPRKNVIPTLVPEPIEAAKEVTFYPIEGALIVVDGMRVGRLVDDKIEWLRTLPELNQWLGGSTINGAYGKWPDVDIRYSSNNGRASQPSVFPLTGKGSTVTFAPGGGLGWVTGWGRLGDTTIVGGYDSWQGSRIATLRGPGLVIKPITAEKAGCKEDEIRPPWEGGDPIAVPFDGLAVTAKGTLVTVGKLCGREKAPVAEVWDKPGKSRIIDLGAWIKDVGYFPRLFTGKGDDLWIVSRPILHYSDGKFEPLPMPDQPVKNHFVSADGKLHGIAGRTILRFDEGKWTPIANLARRMNFSNIAMDEKGDIYVAYAGVSRLREAKDAELEGACKTPFVYLYEVSWKNEAKYTFPTTRKALSTFPEVSDITLVEYWEEGRKLGIKVKSEAQGEAVIAHVKANMKDEWPELICFEPRSPRVIEMKAGK